MRERALDFIVCPKCRGPVALDAGARQGDHIMDGQLTCRGCQATYPVEGGVPVLVEERRVDPDNRRTAERFGFEWETFDTLTPTYEAQFLDWISPIRREFFAGKTILDAGCGKGRHSVLSARFGARDVIGIDLATGSVRAAFRNTQSLTNVHILQADIYNLPFREGTFDYAYSIGVLHHTPDPRRSFQCLVRTLAVGGTISVWVYGREGNEWLISCVNPVRTAVTARLPLGVTKAIAFGLTAVLHPLLQIVYRPANRLPPLRPVARRLFYNDYLFYISSFSFRENYSIVFDHLLPEIAHYIPEAEVRAWFEQTGLQEIVVTRRTNNSWRGTGRKA